MMCVGCIYSCYYCTITVRHIVCYKHPELPFSYCWPCQGLDKVLGTSYCPYYQTSHSSHRQRRPSLLMTVTRPGRWMWRKYDGAGGVESDREDGTGVVRQAINEIHLISENGWD